MGRGIPFALCVALLGVPCTAGADTGLAPRLRLHGGYTHITRETTTRDGWGGALPQLAFFVIEPRTMLRLTYSFGFTVRSTLPSEISNRLELVSSYELSPRTRLLLSALASQSSINQAFLTQSAGETELGAVPPARTQLASFRLSEATSWEASPVVRVDQQLAVRFVTPFGVPAPARNYLVDGGVSIERTFERDAVGGLVRGAYAYRSVPNERDQQIVSTALAPRWRHDISRALTSSLAAGASLVASPDPNTKVLVRPFGLAALVLEQGDATFELDYVAGPQANVITAQLLDAHRVTFRTVTPLSTRHGVALGASAGYMHGERIDLRRDVASPSSFDAILADVGLSWSPAQWVQLFARYQFFDQWGGASSTTDASASVMRNAVLGGVQLLSQEGGLPVRSDFPRRVDRGDAGNAGSSGNTRER